MSRFRTILLILAAIGPGIIAAAAGNDAGGITTYTIAGAHFGYKLLWSVLPVTVVLVVVQEMCTRLGVVSGKGLADLIRESYGARVTFYMLSGLLAANFATVISEFAGIASSMEIFRVPRFVSVPIAAVIVWFVVTQWNYKTLEKIFFVGALLYISYIISGFLAKPQWGEILTYAVRPHLEFNREYILILMGIVGTTVTPWMQFFIQSSVVEKGVQLHDYRYTKLDVATGAITAGVVAFFIMIASAATLFPHGIRVETAAQAAVALEPFAGNFAELLFALGLLNASLLGAMIVPISTAHYICEGLGFESGLNRTFRQAPWFNGIITALLIFGAIPALFPQTPLISVMIVAQVVNGILLAPVLIIILLLINKPWLMEKHVNSWWYNVFAWIVVGLVSALSIGVVIGTFI